MPHGIKKSTVTGKHEATPLNATAVPVIHREMPITWYPSKTEQDMVLDAGDITSNWKYRKYMTRNGVGVIEDNHVRATGMSAASNHPYKSTPEDRRAHIAGMVVGHGMGESGDMRRAWLAKSSVENNTSSPFIVMSDTPVLADDRGKK